MSKRHHEFFQYNKVWFRRDGWHISLLGILAVGYSQTHKNFGIQLFGFEYSTYTEEE